MAIQVSIYLNEGDRWERRPLTKAIVDYLYYEGIAGATVIRAQSGFTGRGVLKSAGKRGKKPPLILTFIDTEDHVRRVLPHLHEMAGFRLIVQQEVTVSQGALE